jgi:integrase
MASGRAQSAKEIEMARVFKRKESWWIDYFHEGRRYRQKIGAKRKAVDALAAVMSKRAAGEFIAPDKRRQMAALERKPILFETFAREEYLPWSETHHSAQHHRLQQSILRVQLLPHFDRCPLHEITPKMLDDYVSQRKRGTYLKGRKRRPVKAGTVNRDIACLKILFRKAVEWDMLEESPTKSLKALTELPNAPRLLEQDEVARLLEAMPDHQKALVACAVYAGLRRAELFHLQWRDVDLQKGELNVVSSEMHPTKGKRSRRIPLNDALQEALGRHPRRLGCPWVFGNQDGKPYDNVRKALDSAAQVAGIEDGVGLHQLRHAFCSHGLMQGVDPRTMQQWMGHRSLATTLKYAHVSPAHEKAAIQRLQYNTWHQGGTSVLGT